MLNHTIKLLTFFLLVVTCCITFYKPIEIEDIQWHLKSGQWIVQNKQVPCEDIFSFTQEKASWKLTQWLGSSFFYLIYHTSGEIGLKIFRTLIFLLVILIFYLYAEKRTFHLLAVLLSVLLSYGLNARGLLRPFIFNFLFIEIYLICLFRHQETNNPRYLILLPFAGIIWTNIHLGSFVYGYFLISLFLFVNLIAYLNQFFKKSDNPKPSLTISRIKHCLFLLLAFFLISFISPYGKHNFIFPLKVFLLPNTISFYKLNYLIEEMSPSMILFRPSGAWAVLLSLASIVSLRFNKHNRFVCLLLFVFAFFAFLRFQRLTAFFSIISVFIIVESLKDSLPRRKEGDLKYFSQKMNIVLHCFVSLFLMLQIYVLSTQKVYTNNQLTSPHHLNYSPHNPILALQTLQDNNIQGTLFNSDIFGGYLLLTAYPDYQPFVDGRQANQYLFRRYSETVTNPTQNWFALENEFNFQIALIDASSKSGQKTIKHLNNLADWQLVFIDNACLIFLKRGVFDLPKPLADFESILRTAELTTESLNQFVELVEKSKTNDPFFAIQPNITYIDLLDEAQILFELGYHNAAIRHILKAATITEKGIVQQYLKTFRISNLSM